MQIRLQFVSESNAMENININNTILIHTIKITISVIKAKLKKNFFIVQLYWYMG